MLQLRLPEITPVTTENITTKQALQITLFLGLKRIIYPTRTRGGRTLVEYMSAMIGITYYKLQHIEGI